MLTADSGSTKTEWVATSSYAGGGSDSGSVEGPGLNPHFLDSRTMEKYMTEVRDVLGADFDEIRFYGAGVGTPEMVGKIEGCLAKVFDCPDIKADSDMVGAASAVLGADPGIACIMGTGSNSCHYDGARADRLQPSLGYILDDNGGGVAFGRRLLSDVLKGIAPREIREAFQERYSLSVVDALDHLYHQPAPNRWIAGFMPFVVEHRRHPYMATMIEVQVESFLDREFVHYTERELKEEGIGFVGSVAAELADVLKRNLADRGWRLRGILRSPLKQ